MIPICIPTYSMRSTDSGCVRLENRRFGHWVRLRLALCTLALLFTAASLTWEYLDDEDKW